jgi:cell division protein FtsN
MKNVPANERKSVRTPTRSGGKTGKGGRQRGGFLLGAIVGLLIGLAAALGVALYVTKVPIPFMNKVQQRTPEQDAAEVQKNRNWDPNGSLAGKFPPRPPGSVASGTVTPPASSVAIAPPTVPTAPVVPTPPSVATAPSSAASAASAPRSRRDPAAILADLPSGGVSTRPSADPFSYFVQAGAYARTEEADQQRAKLAMIGLTARITEREQAGRTVYRVRVGPYDKKEDADSAKEKLDGAGVESALVRVQK